MDNLKKKCIKCELPKELYLFCKDKRNSSGYGAECKECSKRRQRSREGLANGIYVNQKISSKRRGHNPPEYTKEEFKNWLFSQPKFDELYNNWVLSNFERSLTPSIDRLNDYKGYSFDNIRLTAWKDNNIKGHNDRKEGRNNKINKAVLQFDLKGNFISEFHSFRFAERETGVNQANMNLVCQGKRKTAGGFIWKYKQ